MYRLFITFVLCLQAASSAPQGKDSQVTYVKIQPVVEDTPLEAAASARESRIEKLPLTIPGNVSIDKKISEPPSEPKDSTEKVKVAEDRTNDKQNDEKSETQADFSEIETTDSTNLDKDLPDNLDVSETNQSEQISEPDATIPTTDETETSATDDLTVSNSENQPEIISSETSQSETVAPETNQTDRRGRNFASIETTETGEDATEKYEDDLIDQTLLEPPRTKPPKFVPRPPKLGYYPKPQVFQSYSSNHLDTVGKRKFRSRCSCQKIWNCPKLQISVPRCPDEYFLCCF